MREIAKMIDSSRGSAAIKHFWIDAEVVVFGISTLNLTCLRDRIPLLSIRGYITCHEGIVIHVLI